MDWTAAKEGGDLGQERDERNRPNMKGKAEGSHMGSKSAGHRKREK